MLLRLASVVFFQLLVGGVGFWGLAQASNALRSFFDVELLETSALARVGADMNMVGIDLRRAALSESASVVAETLPRVKAVMADVGDRSEERRVGKEGVGTCRSRWSQDH